MLIRTFLAALIFIIYPGLAFARSAVPYIFNLPTCETYGSGILMLDVGHRYFDPIRHTTNVNISLGYGILDSFDANVGRSFKNLDTVFSVKYSLIRDDKLETYLPSIAMLAGGGYKEDTEKVLNRNDRSSGFAEVIVQKHFFSNRFSLGLVPIFANNTNFYHVDTSRDRSFGAGVFIEWYMFDRISLCGETVANLYGFAFKYMNYNTGVKYAGFRHTFSVWIGNSAGYSPVEYVVGNETLKPKLSIAFTREFDL